MAMVRLGGPIPVVIKDAMILVAHGLPGALITSSLNNRHMKKALIAKDLKISQRTQTALNVKPQPNSPLTRRPEQPVYEEGPDCEEPEPFESPECPECEQSGEQPIYEEGPDCEEPEFQPDSGSPEWGEPEYSPDDGFLDEGASDSQTGYAPDCEGGLSYPDSGYDLGDGGYDSFGDDFGTMY
ncbi:hypothetical protein Malapachy_3162 [Malassezia pachydermatis]|uniref:Uncharacterized protein n=1 Tax=Malassezia pachydermatis TaxID=77020 RepID=A0A0M8MQK8_9BASI|nr:hypothetical protein Malapachy_3162 [Malassezia pachydermatis]KOS16348.1 hypothetical protein Malapachy_3162 [Malassezia pachydermatis]